MNGSSIIIKPNRPLEFRQYTGFVEEGHFNEIIDGLLAPVSHFDEWYDNNGVLNNCVMYVDEEAQMKELPVNHVASAYWTYVIHSRKLTPRLDGAHILLGPAVIVFGDSDFLEAL